MNPLLLVSLALVFLQVPQNSSSSAGTLEARKIYLEVDRRLPVNLPSPEIRDLPKCKYGRCYALFALDPEHGFRSQIGGFNLQGQSFLIDPSLIPGLLYQAVMDFAPVEGGLAVLVRADAAKGLRPAHVPGKPVAGIDRATDSEAGNHAYLVTYDVHGALKSVCMLDLSFLPIQMASIPGDRLIITGFDAASEKPVLAVVNQDGTDARLLDDKNVFPDRDALLASSGMKLEKDSTADLQRFALAGAISDLQFAYAGDEVLLLNRSSSGSIVWSMQGRDIQSIRATKFTNAQGGDCKHGPLHGPRLARAGIFREGGCRHPASIRPRDRSTHSPGRREPGTQHQYLLSWKRFVLCAVVG